MKITITGVKIARHLSEETTAFSGTVMIDYRAVGTARNQGHGGATMIDPRSLEERLDAYAKTLPERDIGDESTGKLMIQPNAEMLISDALERWRQGQILARRQKMNLVFTRKDKPGIFVLRLRPGVSPREKADMLLADAQFVSNSQPDTFLNLVPFDQALDLWMADLERSETAKRP